MIPKKDIYSFDHKDYAVKYCNPIYFYVRYRQSEELLKPKKAGTYLIRVSESRFGYTLSFK